MPGLREKIHRKCALETLFRYVSRFDKMQLTDIANDYRQLEQHLKRQWQTDAAVILLKARKNRYSGKFILRKPSPLRVHSCISRLCADQVNLIEALNRESLKRCLSLRALRNLEQLKRNIQHSDDPNRPTQCLVEGCVAADGAQFSVNDKDEWNYRCNSCLIEQEMTESICRIELCAETGIVTGVRKDLVVEFHLPEYITQLKELQLR